MDSVNWTKLWETKKQFLQSKHKQALELLNVLLKKENINSLCDFGCGQGTLLKEIRELYPKLHIYGADNNEYSENEIKKLGINYFDFDLLKDVNKKELDLAILTDVLEHFYNPIEVISNISNIKYLIIIVPNFNFVTERWSVVKGDVPFQMKQQRGGHFFWFNKFTLDNLVDNSEYEIITKLNTYPKKIEKLPFLKQFDNLFATSYGLLLRRK